MTTRRGQSLAWLRAHRPHPADFAAERERVWREIEMRKTMDDSPSWVEEPDQHAPSPVPLSVLGPPRRTRIGLIGALAATLLVTTIFVAVEVAGRRARNHADALNHGTQSVAAEAHRYFRYLVAHVPSAKGEQPAARPPASILGSRPLVLPSTGHRITKHTFWVADGAVDGTLKSLRQNLPTGIRFQSTKREHIGGQGAQSVVFVGVDLPDGVTDGTITLTLTAVGTDTVAARVDVSVSWQTASPSLPGAVTGGEFTFASDNGRATVPLSKEVANELLAKISSAPDVNRTASCLPQANRAPDVGRIPTSRGVLRISIERFGCGEVFVRATNLRVSRSGGLAIDRWLRKAVGLS
jgi:hypothetical protein